ncbi:SpoIIE family protein phosphatase [Streptomyces anulatus]
MAYQLFPGDLLLLYSDGACEARPHPGTTGRDAPGVFGEDELVAALAATHTLDATSTIRRLTGTLAAHHGGWASDDTALLVT